MNGTKALGLMFRPEFMWWFMGSDHDPEIAPCDPEPVA
jgi:hypothetical protein